MLVYKPRRTTLGFWLSSHGSLRECPGHDASQECDTPATSKTLKSQSTGYHISHAGSSISDDYPWFEIHNDNCPLGFWLSSHGSLRECPGHDASQEYDTPATSKTLKLQSTGYHISCSALSPPIAHDLTSTTELPHAMQVSEHITG